MSKHVINSLNEIKSTRHFSSESRVKDYFSFFFPLKIVSEYDQEIPQSQTADKPMAQRERATQQPRDTRKTNQTKQATISFPSR